MRKYIKNELLDIVKQLEKVNATMKKGISTLHVEQVVEALTDCQQSAVDIGERIEEIEGEGTTAVKHLEEYCEAVYNLCMVWGDKRKTKKYIQKIIEHLNAVKNSICYELPEDKTVIVFLPYKAAMWDSLESVWMAADADNNCVAYVVPIPYFDKNPDGSFREMHYEGDMYPSYVPITSWETFDLQKIRPDVIFFHNPYDNYNYVTSVHPRFYAKELKKTTDMLVYIPYFVHQNNQVAEQYCCLSGVFWADKVILQSEEVKEKYIEYYTEAMEIKDKKELPNKFLALGSPKLDRRKDRIEVPEEWKGFLGDGSKKVLFFNTHLNGVMKNNFDNFIKKLQWVFKIVQEQDGIVLLWRPHPLTMETIHSMNKDAEESYSQLVEMYKKDKIGIYDDTPDLHRAIEISTAYYGSRSSVAELFQNCGKPVMYMNLEYLGEE